MFGERHFCAVDDHTTIPKKSNALIPVQRKWRHCEKCRACGKTSKLYSWQSNVRLIKSGSLLAALNLMHWTTKKSRTFATLPISNFHFRSLTCFNTQANNNKKTLFRRRTGNLMIVFFSFNCMLLVYHHRNFRNILADIVNNTWAWCDNWALQALLPYTSRLHHVGKRTIDMLYGK